MAWAGTQLGGCDLAAATMPMKRTVCQCSRIKRPANPMSSIEGVVTMSLISKIY